MSRPLDSERRATEFAVIATLFTFARDAVPVAEPTRFRRRVRPSVFAWKESGEAVRLKVRRGAGD